METSNEKVAKNIISTNVKLMEKSDKTLVITTANQYIAAKRGQGDMVATYKELVSVIKQMESKYNFRVAEDGKDEGVVINEFLERVELATNQVTGNKYYTCVFGSTDEANSWLSVQKNLEIKNISVDTSYAGLDVKRIKLEYIVSSQSNNNKYQICEERRIRFFFGSNQKKFRSKWEAKHPQFNYVTAIKKKWGFSLIGGSVGFFRFIKEKYIVLYSIKYR